MAACDNQLLLWGDSNTTDSQSESVAVAEVICYNKLSRRLLFNIYTRYNGFIESLIAIADYYSVVRCV